MSVLANLAFMLSLLGVGIMARTVGLLTRQRTDHLTRFAYVVALPALIFTSTFDQPLGDVVSATLVVFVLGVYATTLGLGYLVHRGIDRPDRRSVALVQSYHANLGFLGLPLVAANFGALATAKASLILGLSALVQVPLTIVILATLNGHDDSLTSELRALGRNPVLLSLGAGLGFSALALGIPAPIETGLGWLATLALPIALLAVGASLSPDLDAFDVPTVGRVVFVKSILMPLVAAAILLAVTVPESTLQAGLVMFAMPTAVSTFVYAKELGGDPDLASVDVFATTVVSLGIAVALIPLLA